MFYDFFDEMQIGDNGQIVDLVSFGRIMELADFSNRWIYKGSLSSPPCH